MKTNSKLTGNTDVLIVGAGDSGLYTAYRLLEQDNKRKVVIHGNAMKNISIVKSFDVMFKEDIDRIE